MPSSRKEPPYEIPAFGGIFRGTVEKTGERTFHYEGELSYGKGVVKIGLRGDVEIAARMDIPAGIQIPNDLITGIVGMMTSRKAGR